MDWKYELSSGVACLADKAGELYGGTVWFQTLDGGVVRGYFDDLHWFTFRFHSEGAGLSALYPVHGIEWEMWGEDYIFKNADVVRDRIISAGSVTDAERYNRANQEIASFLDEHLLEVRERPVQKYELVREGDASELMMYQDLVPGLAAAVLMIKNEGESERDNGKDNEEA